MPSDAPPPSLAEALEVEARLRLRPEVYDYYAGGAGDEETLRDNRAAFGRVTFVPRVLRDLRERTTATSALGRESAMPLAIAPMAYQRLAHPEGEVATVRAAGRAGVPMALSTMATASVEEVGAAARGDWWLQLYVWRDREATRRLVARAEDAGARALVVTVDAPILGDRRRDERHGPGLLEGLRLGNLEGLGVPGVPRVASGSTLAAHFRLLNDVGLCWADLAWLRSISRLPVVLKGVLAADDARLAVEHGVDAIVVSNHGGRQLDGAIATLDALPAVADAGAGRIEVWFDGGIRSGADVVKALALGAGMILLGRPVLWALATGGEDGVVALLEAIRADLDLALALCGCRSPAEVTPALLRAPR